MGSCLKEGWEKKSFESCINKVVYTKKIQRKDFLNTGEYPIISQEMKYINGYWDNSSDLFRVQKPIIIFGDHTQVLKYINFDFVLGADGVKILKPIKDIHSKYFYYHLKNINLGSLGYARHYRLLKEQSIHYPKSLQEQEKIVTILDEAFSAIDKAKANAELNLQNAKELFESYFRNALSNYSGTIVKLGDICDKVEYGSSSKSSREGLLPVLRMGNIQNRKLVWNDLKYSNNKEDNTKYLLKYNDVLFNRTNSPEWVGKTAIYKDEMPAIFAGYLIRIIVNKDLLDADYLNYFLNSKIAKDYGNTVVISSVNQANINGTKLKTYPIPLPCLKEQQKIVKKLDSLSDQTKKLESIYTKKLQDLEELKESILQKAFNGELT